MNENAQKLVNALRSGEYEQSDGQLRRGDRFCCLGVACDLFAKETGQGEWESVNNEYWKFGGERDLLPTEVRDWLGFTTNDGNLETILEDDGFGDSFTYDGSLAELNDEGKSFEDIADVIESDETEGLFG